MIEGDRREDGDLSVAHVRRIPLAAHAHLDDGDVDRRVGEGGEGQHGEGLEVGEGLLGVGDQFGVDHVDIGPDVRPVGRKRPVGDRLAIDHDAFVDAHQVGTGHEPGAQPVGAQNALRDSARRRLAVGAGHVNDRVAALRVAQQLGHPAGRLQPRLRRGFAHAGQKLLVDPVGVVLVLRVLEVPLGVVVHVRALVTRSKRAEIGERVRVVVAEVGVIRELIIPIGLV